MLQIGQTDVVPVPMNGLLEWSRLLWVVVGEEVGEEPVGGGEDIEGVGWVRTVLGIVEWQDGVFRADRPADRAVWRRGDAGRERSVWCVLR